MSYNVKKGFFMNRSKILLTFALITTHALFAPPPPVEATANPLQKVAISLIESSPSTWKADMVASAINFLTTDKTPENKPKLKYIAETWALELKRREESKRREALKQLEEIKCKKDLKCLEELRRREKDTPPFSYEAADTSRMPKIINEVLQPLKEIQHKDQQNPAGKTTREMPKRLTQKQRAELEQIVRGAGLAYEILSLDDALAEIIALQPKTAFEKRTEALRLHHEDTSLPLNKAEDIIEEQTEELEAKTEDQKGAELVRLRNKKYSEIEEQTLSYIRNKAFTLTSDAFFKKREERSINAEPSFKKLLNKSFNTVLKEKSLGEQKEKELTAARLAARFSPSKENGYDSALAHDVVTTSEIIREFQAIAADKELTGEHRVDRILNAQQRITKINNNALKKTAEKVYKKLKL